MMNVVSAEPQTQAPAAAATAQAKSFRLKRSGVRPKVFDGIEVCHSMSHELGTPFWYELNIYRTTSDEFVGEVKFFTKSDSQRDTFKTFTAFDTEGLMAKLEEYDPTADIEPNCSPKSQVTEHAAKAALQVAELSVLMHEAKRQWDDVIGDILFQISAS